MKTAPSIMWLQDVDVSDFELDKPTRHLAELIQAKFPLPPGFVITERAYFTFLKENILDHKVSQMLSTIAIERPDSLMQGEQHIMRLFEEAKLSDELQTELLSFYKELGPEVMLSLYSTGQHSAKHLTLFAGREKQFVKKVKDAWAAMFSAHALSHRHNHTLDHLSTGAVVLVQKHLAKSKSGKIYTIDRQTHAKATMTITHGQDHYLLSKKNFTIVDRHLHHEVKTKLTHAELLAIGRLAQKLEKHLYFPQEITWTFSEGQLFILETKPVSHLSTEKTHPVAKLPFARGTRITQTIGTGLARVIHKPSDFMAATGHDVLVMKETKTEDFPKLKKAKAIIAETGHPHTEIATLLRKHGIPTIFNVKDATKHFKTGHLITVHGGRGEIYRGGF